MISSSSSVSAYGSFGSIVGKFVSQKPVLFAVQLYRSLLIINPVEQRAILKMKRLSVFL